MKNLQRSLSAADAAAVLLERRQARASLSSFIRRTFAQVDPGAVYKHNWHIDCIAEHLQAAYHREITKLIINIPPRFMKSISATVAFPAWALGQNPSEQVLAASYSAQLSIKHSMDCRLVMQSAWYKAMFPATRIKRDQNEKSNYETTEQGHRVATSVGGTATGKGGNILILDDPINPKMAMSDTDRNTANEWVDQTWSTRLNDPETGVQVLVMQRLHEDDTTGHLLNQGGWHHICLPNEAPTRQKIHYGNVVKVREEGELLHPERFDAKATEEAKARLGSYGYAGQYQQRPSPKGGGLIKLDWFYRFQARFASANRVIHSWDTAQKAGELNDYTVGGVWHDTPRGHDLVDVYRAKMESPDIRRVIRNMAERDSPHAILIEDKSSGSGVIQDLRRDTTLPIIAIEPEADKVTRMSTCAPLIEAGTVGLPEQAPWLHDLETELEAFPNGAYKDQCDMLSQYLNWIRLNPLQTDGAVDAIGDVNVSDW